METQFKENVYNNYYVVYSSLEYPTRTSKAARQGQEDTSMDAPEEWFVSMKQLPVKSGLPKYRSVRGQKTKKRKAFCHFLPHAIEGTLILNTRNLLNFVWFDMNFSFSRHRTKTSSGARLLACTARSYPLNGTR